MPILTTRNATSPGDDAAQNLRRTLTPTGQRPEAIQKEAIRKIVDALGRHLSGQETLSRDALVRLIEDLSRLLKSPALPQENGRALVRRLTDMLDSLPAPERLAAERGLGGRGPAARAALTGGATMAASSLPTERAVIRNLPLPAPLQPQYVGARAAAPGDLALLQAMLRKTFGADEEAAQADRTRADGPKSETDARTGGDAAKASNVAGRNRTPADMGHQARSEISSGLAEDGAAATTQRTGAGKTAPLPPTLAGGAAERSYPPTQFASKATDRTFGETEAAAGDGADADGPDGTYGPPRAKGESDRQQARPTALRGETATSRSLAETIRMLASDGPDLSGRAGSGRRGVQEHAENALPATASEDASPAHAGSAAPRPRGATAGTQPFADQAATEPSNTLPPNNAPAVQQRARQAGEEPSLQQAIALLVESGLPKEIIPFALVPYPPSEAEAEGGGDEKEPPAQEDDEGGADAELRDDGGEREPQEGGDGDAAEDPDVADAYDLYKKLGGLG